MRERQWQITGPGYLIWRSWDQQHLVYHTGSGDLLVLDDLGACVLRMVQQGQVSESQIVAAVVQRYRASGCILPAQQQTVEQQVTTLLTHMAEQHVIEPVG